MMIESYRVVLLPNINLWYLIGIMIPEMALGKSTGDVHVMEASHPFAQVGQGDLFNVWAAPSLRFDHTMLRGSAEH